MKRRVRYGLLEIRRDCWVDGRRLVPGDIVDLDAERHPQAVLAAAGSKGRRLSSAGAAASVHDFLSDPLDYLSDPVDFI
jgi:hypothetical protein